MTTAIHYHMPQELMRRAKASAALQGKTLKDWVEEAIREKLDKEGR